LKSLIADKHVLKEITKKDFGYKDLDVSYIVLSTRNTVDISVKEFAKSYEHSLKVYQNEIGFYDKVTISN